jgi:hypothetical protein
MMNNTKKNVNVFNANVVNNDLFSQPFLEKISVKKYFGAQIILLCRKKHENSI